MTEFKNRIVEYGTRPASSFLANPQNPRKHPEKQRRAVKGSLDKVGWVAAVCESANSGFLLDGHERIFQALLLGDDTPVPFISVDVTPDEERVILATLDYTGELAEYDPLALGDLLNDIPMEEMNAGIQEMITEMVEKFEMDVDVPEFNTEIDEDSMGDTKNECPKCGFKW